MGIGRGTSRVSASEGTLRATEGSVASRRSAGRLGYYVSRRAAITGSRKRCWMSTCVETQIIARHLPWWSHTSSSPVHTSIRAPSLYQSSMRVKHSSCIEPERQLLFSGLHRGKPGGVGGRLGGSQPVVFGFPGSGPGKGPRNAPESTRTMCTAWRWRRPRLRFYISTVASLCWLWRGLKRPSMSPPRMASRTGPL